MSLSSESSSVSSHVAPPPRGQNSLITVSNCRGQSSGAEVCVDEPVSERFGAVFVERQFHGFFPFQDWLQGERSPRPSQCHFS